MTSLGPHDVSVMVHLLGAWPTAVATQGAAYVQPEWEDVVFLSLFFPGDVLGHVHLSWLDPEKVRRLSVVGSRRMAVLDDMQPARLLTLHDKTALPEGSAPAIPGALPVYSGQTRVVSVPPRQPLRLELEAFVGRSRRGNPPSRPGRTGRGWSTCWRPPSVPWRRAAGGSPSACAEEGGTGPRGPRPGARAFSRGRLPPGPENRPPCPSPPTPSPPPQARPRLLPPPDPPRIPLMDPRRVYAEWGPAAEREVVEVLRAHAYVKGAHVTALEREFAEVAGVRHAVAVDSGTDALFLVLRAWLGVRPRGRREVILPSFTFVATASAVVNAGGWPVFADVDPETHNLDPEAVGRLLSRRTAAVIPVHLFGSPADLTGLARSLAHRRVPVLEDAAQAVGATLHGRPVRGSSAAPGPSPSTRPRTSARRGTAAWSPPTRRTSRGVVAALRDHGQEKKLYDHALVGTNSRMDEIQAAVLRVKLRRLRAWNEARQGIGARYDLALRGTAFRPQRVLPGATSVYHLYTVRAPRRDEVRAGLAARGVSTWGLLPRPAPPTGLLHALRAGRLPGGGRLGGGRALAPRFPGLSTEEQEETLRALRDVAGVRDPAAGAAAAAGGTTDLSSRRDPRCARTARGRRLPPEPHFQPGAGGTPCARAGTHGTERGLSRGTPPRSEGGTCGARARLPARA